MDIGSNGSNCINDAGQFVEGQSLNEFITINWHVGSQACQAKNDAIEYKQIVNWAVNVNMAQMTEWSLPTQNKPGFKSSVCKTINLL